MSADSSNVSDARLVAIYQALSAKWVASRALLWQFPALTLTAQAFLIGAATQLKDSIGVTRVLLAATILAVGVASISIQYRVGREAHLDLVMLDHYESLMLADRSDLLLHHSSPLRKRDPLLTSHLSDVHRDNYLWIFRSRGQWPRWPIGVSLTWVITQTLASIVGAIISVFGAA